MVVWSTSCVPPTPPGTLARPVVSMVLTEPPPPEPSIMRMSGRRSSLAMRSAMMGLSRMVASAEPPRTVKSSPTTTTGRPSTMRAAHHAVGGREVARGRLAASYSAAPAMAPISWKEPRSTSAVDALAHGQAAAVVLALHLVGPAHLARQRLAPAQFVEFRLPAHARINPLPRASLTPRRAGVQPGLRARPRPRAGTTASAHRHSPGAGARGRPASPRSPRH